MNAEYMRNTLEVKKMENEKSIPSLTAEEIQVLFEYKSLSSAHRVINRVNVNKSRMIAAAFIDEKLLSAYNKRAKKEGLRQFATVRVFMAYLSQYLDIPNPIAEEFKEEAEEKKSEIEGRRQDRSDDIAELKATIVRLEKEKAEAKAHAKQITEEYERLVAQLTIEKEDLQLDLHWEKKAYNQMYQCAMVHMEDKEKYKAMASIMSQEIRKYNTKKPIVAALVDTGGKEIMSLQAKKYTEITPPSIWQRPLNLKNLTSSMSFHRK